MRKRLRLWVGSVIAIGLLYLLCLALARYVSLGRFAAERQRGWAEFQKNVGRVHVGMRAEEVRAILGEPMGIRSLEPPPELVEELEALKKMGAFRDAANRRPQSGPATQPNQATSDPATKVTQLWIWGFVWGDYSFFQCIPGLRSLLEAPQTQRHGGGVGLDRDGVVQEIYPDVAVPSARGGAAGR